MIDSIRKWFKPVDGEIKFTGTAKLKDGAEEFAKALSGVNRGPEFVPVILTVPEGDVLSVLRLIDEVDEHDTYASKYQLWSKIQTIFPETKTGKWKLRSETATSIQIISAPE